VKKAVRGGTAARGAVVGITGGMASGKSTLAALLRRRGAAYYSVDEAAHQLYSPRGKVYRRLTGAFGRGILSGDGTVNRGALSGTVFGDPERMRRLERIIHPVLAREASAAIQRMRVKNPLTVVEAGPILFKLGLDRLVDLVVVTECSRQERIGRLARAKGMPCRIAALRIAAFTGLEKRLPRLAAATGRGITVRTDGRPELLADAAETVLGRIRWPR